MTDAQIFEPDDRRIPFADEGEGPGAVVLLPGRGLNISYLSALAAALAEAGHRVVRVGSRHPSSAVQPAVTLHDLAEDVVDVMAHLGLDDAWIGGHGFGGAVARTLSVDHTDRVNGVLLLGVEEPAEDAAAREAADSEVPASARDGEIDAMQQAALDATPLADWTMPASVVPVLVIQGADDRITPPANGERLRAAAPERVSVVTVEGGHLFPATHAGAASWAIEDYLDWD
ncbi:alpha/beta fold hydrolase [Microbacterium luticocti]|uniref:alpha/beta fold hydrolase n=1 Tax=Microbacterium luticocti TaxID=451764 RepID=UPI000422C5EE|nr:alpha/beta hydrolase [Microbacterium luticocti]